MRFETVLVGNTRKRPASPPKRNVVLTVRKDLGESVRWRMDFFVVLWDFIFFLCGCVALWLSLCVGEQGPRLEQSDLVMCCAARHLAWSEAGRLCEVGGWGAGYLAVWCAAGGGASA